MSVDTEVSNTLAKMVSGGQVLHSILHFVYLLLIGSSGTRDHIEHIMCPIATNNCYTVGISYKLYIGAVITAMMLLIIAVVVTW